MPKPPMLQLFIIKLDSLYTQYLLVNIKAINMKKLTVYLTLAYSIFFASAKKT